MKTVRDFQSDDYQFVQNEDEARDIQDMLGCFRSYSYLWIKTKDGEIIEAYGANSPCLDETVETLKEPRVIRSFKMFKTTLRYGEIYYGFSYPVSVEGLSQKAAYYQYKKYHEIYDRRIPEHSYLRT